MGTRETADFDDGDMSVCRTLRGVAFDFQMPEVVGERVGRHVIHLAAEKRFSILADVNRPGVSVIINGDVDRDKVEGWRYRLGNGSQAHFEFRSPGEQVAYEGLG